MRTGPASVDGSRPGVDARERRLSGRPVTNSRSTAVHIAAVTIFVTFAAAALMCVVLGAHRRLVLGLRDDRAATRQLLGAAHSRTMARRESFRNHVPCTGVAWQA
jgi:hypothetical protein